MDTTVRNESMLRVPHRRIGRTGYWSWLRVALVVVAVAHRRLGPSRLATTSTTDRAVPASAVQACSWSRPTPTRLPPLMTNPRHQDRSIPLDPGGVWAKGGPRPSVRSPIPFGRWSRTPPALRPARPGTGSAGCARQGRCKPRLCGMPIAPARRPLALGLGDVEREDTEQE
jgi:hypothetical protein